MSISRATIKGRVRDSGLSDDQASRGGRAAALAGDAMAATSPRPTLAFERIAPRDAEVAMSWHLGLVGDVQKVWEEFTGKGVSVGVYDSGIQYEHWDLDANYDASKHVVVDGRLYDGGYRPFSSSSHHGTSVAGIIAAERNGLGTVGIAHEAALTSVNIFNRYSGGGTDPGIFVNGPNRTAFNEAIRQSDQFDVVNHSWGGGEAYATGNSRSNPDSFASGVIRGVEYSATVGRDGLGTVHVVAAGNLPEDGQSDGMKTDRHVIAVSAFRESDGLAASYANHGAHLLVSAPSDELWWVTGSRGVVTTDLLGRDGQNIEARPGGAFDYTDQFGGTSAAAPMVTGVTALMMDANEGLGWRDVKEILSQSARMPVAFDSGPVTLPTEFRDRRVNESQFRLSGAESDWNGGARHFSADYGYGAVDAHAAVRMAEVWSLFGPAKTSANEIRVDPGTIAIGMLAPTVEVGDDQRFTGFAGIPTSFEFQVGANVDLEHIDLTLTVATLFPDFQGSQSMLGFRFRLVGPDGTSAFVDTSLASASSADSSTYTFGFSAFRGVGSAGTWRIEFEQAAGFGLIETTVGDLKFEGFGSAVTVGDVYSYTDEFFTMAAIAGEDGRRVLSDMDGGVDWINAAAVTKDVSLSLAEGATTRLGGEDAFTIASGSRIEHAVTGDGDDRLIGNALDNRLFGMRGDDWLNGGAGDDWLFGGQGRDVFAFDTAGVSGKDRILDWSFGDRIATSKMLRGVDQNGLVTVGSNALVLLDGNARGDTAELVGQGGATLQAMGRADGYWWYGFVSEGDDDNVDGRVTELALGQTGRPANDIGHLDASASAAGGSAPTMNGAAFYLYDTMGEAMSSGVQLTA